MSAAKDVVIKVDRVSKIFKLPHEKHSSIKSALINFLRGGKQTYERQQALQNVSFEVQRGEFFAIVGRNGSGKSTMLKMLAGIYTPTEGQIAVNGKLTPFIELGVGFNQELSGRENVYLNGALLGFDRKEMDAMYDDIVEFAELERFMDQKLKNYSSGMQVRLAFSIAIRAESDILLLDEVLAVGDAAFQQKCFNYFEELRRENKTVVFVSHDMGAVRRFCTRAVYIQDGVLLYDGEPSEVADRYMAENVESMQEADAKEEIKQGRELPGNSKLTTKILEQTADKLVLHIKYQTAETIPLYVALSILSAGVPFAEISTPPDMQLMGNGEVIYTLDLTHLNGGVYEIPAILCRQHNRELICIGKNKNRFIIKGADITKGGPMRLENTWQIKR